MQLSGYDPIINTTDQTATVVSVPTLEDKRIAAYGYDLMLKTAFNAVASLVVASTGFDFATDVITSASHGLKLGMVYRFTTSGALPTGISAGTDYFIIPLTDDTFQIATTLANAVAGTAVDFSDAGSGNHTLTQQTDVATYQIEVSPNLTDWFVYDAMSAVSVVGNSLASKHFECAAAYIRVKVTITKGNASTITCWLQGKG